MKDIPYLGAPELRHSARRPSQVLPVEEKPIAADVRRFLRQSHQKVADHCRHTLKHPISESEQERLRRCLANAEDELKLLSQADAHAGEAA